MHVLVGRVIELLVVAASALGCAASHGPDVPRVVDTGACADVVDAGAHEIGADAGAREDSGSDAGARVPSCPTGLALDESGGCAAWRAPEEWPTFDAHTATLLNDGRVLVVGRVRHGDREANGAMFDPAHGTFALLDDGPEPLEGRTATLLGDGRVLVAGGTGGARVVADAALFDPRADRWSILPPMASPRAYHAATRLPDGRVLVAGGRSVPAHGSSALLASVERFDPATLTWMGSSPMRGPRERHSASEIDGRVAVVGGIGIDEGIARASRTTELYDPGHDEWTELGALEGGALGHTTTELRGGSLLVVSGSGAFQKTWHSHWEPAGAMRDPRSGHVAARLDDGRVLVAGGTWYRELHTPEIYDPRTSTWTTSVDHPFGIGAGTATRLLDGRVLVVSWRALIYERAPATGSGG